MIHNFDPYAALEQLGTNQKQLDENTRNVVVVVNNLQKVMQDHETRLDLNQATINQILNSLQNQQKLVLSLLDKVNQLYAVNSAKGPDLNDQTSNSAKG